VTRRNTNSGSDRGAAPHGAAVAPTPFAHARAVWGRCKAIARSTGKRCRAEGGGVNGLCPMHYGLALARGRWKDPQPVWQLSLSPAGCWIGPSRAPRGWRRSVWPQRIRHWIGVRLVASGQIARGTLHRSEGSAFLSELQRCGVRLIVEEGDAVVRRLRFEVDNPDVSKRLACRNGKRRDNG
jgi:hypothetical protein